MTEGKLLGVDIGTQGTKGALFSPAGEPLAEAYRQSRLIYPGPGRVEEEPEEQLAAACEVIRVCIEKSGSDAREIAALAVDGQMAGILGIGADGRHITPYDSWLDTRCAPYIERMAQEAGGEVLHKSGAVPSFNHGPKILWWKHERPEVYARIAAFLPPGSYVAMRLAGLRAESAFVDDTYLHFSGFADNERREWDEGLCRCFGVDRSKLPAIVEPARVIGRISGEAAGVTGLLEGTPVAAGCGDTAASFLSCGATEIGRCVDVAGTASVFAATTGSFSADEESLTIACARSATPGLWHPYAYINGGGLNLEWFRRTTGLGGEAPGKGGSGRYEDLDALAETLPFAESDPYFIPHFGGRVTPSAPHLRGAWTGLEWSHGLGHLYRAMLEGVAHEYGIYLTTIRRLYPGVALTTIRATGGGAANRLWSRIKAAACGLPVAQVHGSAGAPLGAAIVAGVASGVLEGVPAAAAAWVRTEAETPVDPALADHFARRQGRYEELIAMLTGLSR